MDAEYVMRVGEAFLIALVISICLGGWVALVSHRAEKVRGGALAQVLHYLGAVGVVGTLPGGIAAIIRLNTLPGPKEWYFIIPGLAIVALAFVLLSVVSLWLHAMVEHPARAALATQEDRGWTEQDARTSGL